MAKFAKKPRIKKKPKHPSPTPITNGIKASLKCVVVFIIHIIILIKPMWVHI